MIVADLNWLSQVLGAPFDGRVAYNLNQKIVNITTDSRTIVAGEVFVALKGPNFDGHKFVAEVQNKGAIAAVVEQLVDDAAIPQIVVPNTLKALGALGAAVAEGVGAKTIAITGSVGKTSVKEMCAQILRQKGEVLATAGNFNNEIGVPLTLLRLEEKHQFAVVELGANHLGEIAYTTRLAKPDVAILNNVAEAHLEGFGSLQGVANAKSEIYEGLKPNGVAIFNHESDYRKQWLDKLDKQFGQVPGRVVEFALWPSKPEPSAASDIEFSASDITLADDGCASFDLHHNDDVQRVKLAVPGKHNVLNALAAASACFQVGASLTEIVAGLSTSASVKGRVNLNTVTDRMLVIDDTYNANVQSVKAAIDLLQSYDAQQILILGDMAELGQDARRLHQEVGLYGLKAGVHHLFSFGVLSQSASQEFAEQGGHYASQSQLINDVSKVVETILSSATDSKVVVLVKGSRSAKMELVVEQLIQNFNNKNNTGNPSC